MKTTIIPNLLGRIQSVEIQEGETIETKVARITQNTSTYIDPTIYNNIFAESRLSSQNFWVQVAFDVTARRVMSAKQIPNL